MQTSITGVYLILTVANMRNALRFEALMKRFSVLLMAVFALFTTTSLAVEVYSPVTVGFIRIDLQADTWHLLGVSFEQDDEEQTGLADVLGTQGIPDGTRVMVWDADDMKYISSMFFSGSWSGDIVLTPGLGFWIRPPVDCVITLAGRASMAEKAAVPVVEGYQLISSPYPGAVIPLDIENPSDGDQIIAFDGVSYVSSMYFGGQWSGSVVLDPGYGYWYRSRDVADRVLEIPRPYGEQ